MLLRDHWSAIAAGNIAPRVVQRSFEAYVAWTPTWEGPARPDYPAALADLNERLRAK